MDGDDESMAMADDSPSSMVETSSVGSSIESSISVTASAPAWASTPGSGSSSTMAQGMNDASASTVPGDMVRSHHTGMVPLAIPRQRCSFLTPNEYADAMKQAGAAASVVAAVIQAAEKSITLKNRELEKSRDEVVQANVNVENLLADIHARQGPNYENMYKEARRQTDELRLHCVKLRAEVETLKNTRTAISVLNSGANPVDRGKESAEGDTSPFAAGQAVTSSMMSDETAGSASMMMGSSDQSGGAEGGAQSMRAADVFNDIAALLDEMDRKMNFDKNAVTLEDLELLQEFLQGLLEMQQKQQQDAQRAIQSIQIDMERVQERVALMEARQQTEQAERERKARANVNAKASAAANPFGVSLPSISNEEAAGGGSGSKEKRKGTDPSMAMDEDASISGSSMGGTESSGLGGSSRDAEERARQQRRLALQAKKRRVRENVDSLRASFAAGANDGVAGSSGMRGGLGGQGGASRLDMFAKTLSTYTRFTEMQPVATFAFGSAAEVDMETGGARGESAAGSSSASRHITSVRFNLEDEYFALCTRGGDLAVYALQVTLEHGADPTALAPLQRLSSPHAMNELCWSPFAKGQLATADEAGRVILWDAQTGSKVIVYSDHRAAARSVHYSAQAKHVFASASLDHGVNIYHTTQRECTATVKAPEQVYSVRFNPLLENEITFGCADSNLYVYDIRNIEEPVRTLRYHRGPVSGVVMLGRDEVLSQSYDGSLLYWKGDRQRPIREYRGHKQMRSVNLGIDSMGDFFATGSEDNRVFVYNKSLEHPVLSHSFDTGISSEDERTYVSALSWKSTSNVLVACNTGGICKVLGLK